MNVQKKYVKKKRKKKSTWKNNLTHYHIMILYLINNEVFLPYSSTLLFQFLVGSPCSALQIWSPPVRIYLILSTAVGRSQANGKGLLILLL